MYWIDYGFGADLIIGHGVSLLWKRKFGEVIEWYTLWLRFAIYDY